MKTVLALVCIISAAYYVSADCNALKTFTTELKPSCSINDIYIKWPNYANQSTYYACLQVGVAELVPCPAGDYFIYVLQKCGPCSTYIPPVPCDKLKTELAPVCVPIGSSSGTTNTTPPTGYPTPLYPSTTPSTEAPSTSARTARTTRGTSSTTADTTIITPPTVKRTTAKPTTAFPGPPSPVTSNSNVPVPPTPAPTPPTIEEEPPIVIG